MTKLSEDINIYRNMIIKYANNNTKIKCLSSSNKFLHINHHCVIMFLYFSGLPISSNFGMRQQGLTIEFDFSHIKMTKTQKRLCIGLCIKKVCLNSIPSIAF